MYMPIPRPRLPRRATLALVFPLALLLFLAGCGLTSTTSTGGAPSPTPSATATPMPGKLVAMPCPAGETSAYQIPANAVVATHPAQKATISAKVGQPVVIELPATLHWIYLNTRSSAANLSAPQPAGQLDIQRHVCIWTFQTLAPGTAALQFSGTPICPAKRPCPQYILAETITVQVS